MKNKIYYLGIANCMIIAAGCFFKLLHWPFASILLMLGILLLALVFLPMALHSSYKNETNQKLKPLYILTAIVFALCFLGSLFTILHWPGARPLVIISTPLPFVVLLPAFLILNKTDKDINYKNFMAIVFFFAYLAAITALLSLNVSRSVIDGFARNANMLQNQSKAISISCNITNDSVKQTTIINLVDSIQSQIETIKKDLIVSTGQNIPTTGIQDVMNIKYKDSRPIIDERPLQSLKTNIDKLCQQVLDQCKTDTSLCQYTSQVLNTNNNWEKTLLQNKLLIAAIENLNQLQTEIQLIEYEIVTK